MIFVPIPDKPALQTQHSLLPGACSHGRMGRFPRGFRVDLELISGFRVQGSQSHIEHAAFYLFLFFARMVVVFLLLLHCTWLGKGDSFVLIAVKLMACLLPGALPIVLRLLCGPEFAHGTPVEAWDSRPVM